MDKMDAVQTMYIGYYVNIQFTPRTVEPGGGGGGG